MRKVGLHSCGVVELKEKLKIESPSTNLIFSRPDSFPRAINKIDKNYQNDFASLLPAIVTPTVKEEKRIIRI
jgi:hypothetical protein